MNAPKQEKKSKAWLWLVAVVVVVVTVAVVMADPCNVETTPGEGAADDTGGPVADSTG